MPFGAIVLLSIGAAVVYGILHDQVTARICVEYFTIGHPPIFNTDNPTLLGIGWGILATWWVGLILGVPLAFAARAGSRPKREVRTLFRPIGWFLIILAANALLAGCIGWLLASNGVVKLDPYMAGQLPQDRHVPFLIDLWAHSASYLVGFIGGIVLVVNVWRSRREVM
jgi:hypothetical protein